MRELFVENSRRLFVTLTSIILELSELGDKNERICILGILLQNQHDCFSELQIFTKTQMFFLVT